MKTKKRDVKRGNLKSPLDISLLEEISKEQLKELIADLSEKFSIKSDDMINLFNKKLVSAKNYELVIPISIFDNDELSALESIVKYFKEELNLRFKEIALALNRNNRTIWSTYRSSQEKSRAKFQHKNSKYVLPVSILRNRALGVLEAVVVYLKEEKGLRFHEIAVFLNRNDRTIWTCHNRAKKKLK